MIPLIKELKEIMEKNDLSLETASHYLDCSTRSIYRWTNKGLLPSQISKRRIRQGIAKIREAYPEKKKDRPRFQLLLAFCVDNLNKLSEKEKDFWELIISKMTPDETRATYWVEKDKKTMTKQILKAAKRLNIPYKVGEEKQI